MGANTQDDGIVAVSYHRSESNISATSLYVGNFPGSEPPTNTQQPRLVLADTDQARVNELKTFINKNNANNECSKIYHNLLNDDSQLHRILVARQYQLEASWHLFMEQVRFRERWWPVSSETISSALSSGAWRLAGFTKEGCIVSNYKLQYWNPNSYDADEYVRYVVYMLELMIGNMKGRQQQFVVVFDLRGFQPKWIFNRNVRHMIRKLIYVAQSQYPERLQTVLLVHAPRGFATAWALIRGLLDEKTANKVQFCTSLQTHIDGEQLSVAYGGSREEYPLVVD